MARACGRCPRMRRSTVALSLLRAGLASTTVTSGCWMRRLCRTRRRGDPRRPVAGGVAAHFVSYTPVVDALACALPTYGTIQPVRFAATQKTRPDSCTLPSPQGGVSWIEMSCLVAALTPVNMYGHGCVPRSRGRQRVRHARPRGSGRSVAPPYIQREGLLTVGGDGGRGQGTG